MTKPDDTIRVLIPLNLKTAVTPQWQGLSGGFEGGLSALPADMWGRITISSRLGTVFTARPGNATCAAGLETPGTGHPLRQSRSTRARNSRRGEAQVS
jgi:hypothetical protein